MLLDTGDALTGGGVLGDTTKGKAIVAGMNQMGYNAMALGPNELSLGSELLKQRMSEAQFPMLSANVTAADGQELFSEAYIVLKVGQHRIGVIGLTRVPSKPAAGFQVLDPFQAAPKIVPEVRKLADTIVVLTNMDYAQARALAANVQGIDLVIAALPQYIPAQVVTAPSTGTLVVSADMATPKHSGRRVGKLVVSIGSGGKLSQSSFASIAMDAKYADDAQMTQMLNTYR